LKHLLTLIGHGLGLFCGGKALYKVEVFLWSLGGLDYGFRRGAESGTPLVKRLVPG